MSVFLKNCGSPTNFLCCRLYVSDPGKNSRTSGPAVLLGSKTSDPPVLLVLEPLVQQSYLCYSRTLVVNVTEPGLETRSVVTAG